MNAMLQNTHAPPREEQVMLTFWVPERIDACLSELEALRGQRRSEVLRGQIRQHLYGLFGSPEETRLRNADAFARKPARGEWGGRMPELGKNTIEVKLLLAQRWRDDLEILAADAGISLSHYMREIVAATLFGRAWLPERALRPHTQAQRDEG